MSGIAVSDDVRKNALDYISFLNETGSPYHTIKALVGILKESGFEQLDEKETWKIEKKKKYFVIKNFSSIMAFIVGENFSSNNSGFCIVATHSDSPCLRIRPNSHAIKDDQLQLSVECYGGGLWHTWFDRGLGCAGKVVVKKDDDVLEENLVRINRPIAILPNLAIHLQNAEERSAFKINNETHLQPIICSKIKEELIDPPVKDSNKKDEEKISPPLANALAKELNVNKGDIVDMDICLMDATESRLCGVYEEFIESPRLDNLTSTYAAFRSITNNNKNNKNKNNNNNDDDEYKDDICIAFAFDHEEIGSQSWVGAGSNTLQLWMCRILRALNCYDKYDEILCRSFLLSSDMAHALHPNYPDKHQKEHKIYMHKGVVLKENCNQRYTSMASTSALCRMIAKRYDVLLQNFAIKNSCPCGSTVGPIISTNIGVRAADIGVPQWAMHSCREICGVEDLTQLIRFISGFFKSFRQIDNKRIEIKV